MTRPFIVVTTGSRTWTDEAKIKSVLQDLQQEHDKLTIIVGYNSRTKKPTGADKMVYKWCDVLNIKCIPEPADWKNGRVNYFGNRPVNMAGFDRNELMLDKHEPDLVVAFRARGISNGTDHCIIEARRRDIPVERHYERNTRSSSNSADD